MFLDCFDFLDLLLLYNPAEIFYKTGKWTTPGDHFRICALFDNVTMLKGIDIVDLGQKVQSMSDQQDRLTPRPKSQDGMFEERFTDMRIHSAKRVVEKLSAMSHMTHYNICVKVDRSGDIDTLFLTSRKVDPFFADLSAGNSCDSLLSDLHPARSQDRA